MGDEIVWPYTAIVSEGEPLSLGPIENVWAHTWHHLDGPRVTVHHPHYPDQTYQATPVEIRDGARRVVFCAVELSNYVYGFYQPDGADQTGS